MRWRSAVLGVCALLGASTAHADPDAMGPSRVESWEAGVISLAGAQIRVVAYFPAGASGRPVAGVIHGASRNGAYQRVLAQTLASYGLVALVPDMPCQVWSCDHEANARQLLALLDWGVTQSRTPGTRLTGAIDPTRRGLIGHSWGALGSALAASRTSSLASLVLLDPNDDLGAGAAVSSRITAPTLTLLAENRALCNNQWVATTITPSLRGPAAHATVAASGHCDPEDPTDALCPVACGRGDASTTPLYRRYAVAWTLCNLTGAPAMAPWVLGPAWDADQRARRLTGVVRSGTLGSLRCLGDAGVEGPDAGMSDVVIEARPDVVMDDVPAVIDDAPAAMHDVPAVIADAPTVTDTPRVDARAAAGGVPVRDGCGCATAGSGASGGWLGLALAALLRRRRRRETPSSMRRHGLRAAHR